MKAIVPAVACFVMLHATIIRAQDKLTIVNDAKFAVDLWIREENTREWYRPPMFFPPETPRIFVARPDISYQFVLKDPLDREFPMGTFDVVAILREHPGAKLRLSWTRVFQTRHEQVYDPVTNRFHTREITESVKVFTPKFEYPQRVFRPNLPRCP